MPVRKVIGGPAFRSACSDWLLQMAQFVAHALLVQEEQADERDVALGHGGRCEVMPSEGWTRSSTGTPRRSDPQGVVRF